jgi:hypothetical protein
MSPGVRYVECALSRLIISMIVRVTGLTMAVAKAHNSITKVLRQSGTQQRLPLGG